VVIETGVFRQNDLTKKHQLAPDRVRPAEAARSSGPCFAATILKDLRWLLLVPPTSFSDGGAATYFRTATHINLFLPHRQLLLLSVRTKTDFFSIMFQLF
jgi:hypothetical protein